MSKHNKTEPSFFKWIRSVRKEIYRETEGMTAEEHVAYIHARAEESRRERMKRLSESQAGTSATQEKTKATRKRTSSAP